MTPLALQSLDIAEYRGLNGMKLENFARINLFVGGNNAGKTSVLEALALFSRPLDIDNWVNTAWRREIKGSRIPVAETIKWMFPRRAGEPDDSGRIWITGQGGFEGRRLLAQYHEEKVVPGIPQEPVKGSFDIGHTPAGIPIAGTNASSGSWGAPPVDQIGRALSLDLTADFIRRLPGGEERGDNQNRVSVRIAEDDSLTYGGRPQEPLLPLAVVDASAHRVEATVQDLYSAALRAEQPDRDLKSDFIRVLQKIDPGIQRLDLVQTGRVATRLQIKHEKTGVTPISALGDGFRRALMIAVTIPTVRGGILLIDELETALHVKVLDSVLGLLKWATEEFDVQVFATTHSLEAVDAVCHNFASALTEVAGYRLERSEAGPVVKRYPGPFMNDIRFERGLDIR
jgi:ABC-type dipeptide/oligopeptide/nickel transport system ATPase subunit